MIEQVDQMLSDVEEAIAANAEQMTRLKQQQGRLLSLKLGLLGGDAQTT